MGLPWFRADTNLHSHDKILDLIDSSPKGLAAVAVYFSSLSFSVGNGNDGVIKKGHLRFVHGNLALAALIVAVELWDVIDGGWQIHNYGTRQVVGMSEQVKAEEISAARAAAGTKGAEAKWSDK